MVRSGKGLDFSMPRVNTLAWEVSMLAYLVLAGWGSWNFRELEVQPQRVQLPASWVPMPIEGGVVNATFTFGPDSVLAVAWPNLWLSFDGGATWQELHYALFGVEHGTVDPRSNAIMLFRDDSVLIRSTDFGLSWDTVLVAHLVSARLASPAFGLQTVYLVGIDTVGDDTLKTYRSDDGGASWTFYGAVPTNLVEIVEVAYSPRDDRFLLLSGKTPDSVVVLVSADGGQTWGTLLEASRNDFKRFHVALNPSDRNTFYIAAVSGDFTGAGSWLRVTSDGGANWATIDTNKVVNHLFAGPGALLVCLSMPEGLKRFSYSDYSDTAWAYADEAVLWASGDGTNLYLGTAGLGVVKGSGGSFSEVNNGLYGVWSQSPFSLAQVGDTLFALDANSGRLYRSVDGGATWERLPLNMVFDAYEGGFAMSVEAVGSKVWVTGISVNVNPPALFTLFLSNDGGDSWTTQSFPFAPLGICVDAVDADTLYLYGTGLTMIPDGVYKSTDGGVNWTNVLEYPIQLFAGFIPWPHVAVKAADEVYFVDTQGVRVSVDGGASWSYLPEYPFPVWRTAATESYLFASVTDLDESSVDTAGLWRWDGSAWQQELLVPTLHVVLIPPDLDARDGYSRRALSWTSAEGGLFGVVAYRDELNDWLYDTLPGLMPTSVNIVQDTCLVVGTFGWTWLKACGVYTGVGERTPEAGPRAWVAGRELLVKAPGAVELKAELYDASGRFWGSWELEGQGLLKLRLPDAPAGVYHIRLLGKGLREELRWVNWK